jgi:hypothetical protein
MTTLLALFAASALTGLAVGLLFRAWAVGLASLLVALLSAVLLDLNGFGLASGVAITIGCLVICQGFYLVGAFFISRDRFAKYLTQDAIDGEPDNGREHGVSDEHEERNDGPSRPPPAQP